MATILRLSNGLGTVNLVDKVNYDVQVGGVETPTPTAKSLYGGDNMFADGSYLVAKRWNNRPVTLDLRLMGTSHDHLSQGIHTLQGMLNKAENAAMRRWGSVVTLEYQWPNASTPVLFDVLEGSLRLPDNYWRILLEQHKTILDAQLELTCKPFARLAPSITHENYPNNPSFEHASAGTPHAWTHNYDTGAVSSDAKYGTASFHIIALAGSGQRVLTGSNILVGTAASTGYAAAWTKWGSVPNAAARLWLKVIDPNDSSCFGSVFVPTTVTGWQKIETSLTKAANSGTVFVRFVREAADDAYETDCYVDGVYLHPSVAGTPIFYPSARTLTNEWDPDTANVINYVTIDDMPGDMPAALRIAGLTGELGQRTRSQTSKYVHNYEAEDGALATDMTTFDDDAYSQGSSVKTPNTGVGDTWTDIVTITVNSNMVDQYGRVRVFCAWGMVAAPNMNVELRAQLKYGSLTYSGKSSGTLSGGVANYRSWADLGVFTLPPGAFVPRDGEVNQWQWVVQYKNKTASGTNRVVIDNLHIVPIDEGYVNYDGHVIDSVSDPPGAWTLADISDDASDYSMAGSVFTGRPLYAQPGTPNRLIWRNGTGLATTGTVRIVASPRFLHVG